MAGYIGSRASVVSSGAERKKTFDITGTTTVLTGLSYTPTFVHLFHNGVRLVDGTDYTATNSTSITLTTAAENGDQVVVVSYATFQPSDTVSASAGGTFAGDVSVTGAFTSLGIDDNAASTAVTIDGSGNVGIGTASPARGLHVNNNGESFIRITSSDTGNAGIEFGDQSDGVQGAIFQNSTDNSLRFNGYNNSERMRIDASGNVGIGTASPSALLSVGNGLTGTKTIAINGGGSSTSAMNLDFLGGGTGNPSGRIGYSSSSEAMTFHTGDLSSIAERLRIDASGNVLVGTASLVKGKVTAYGTGAGNTMYSAQPTTNGYVALNCYNAAGSQVGYIYSSASTTQYNTTSDYRLKENITAIQGAGDIVKAMRPVTYTYKVDGSWMDGFLAHELQELHPTAVNGSKDAMQDEEYEVTPAVEATYDAEGVELTPAVPAVMGTRSVPDYQGVDYSKLTPILTAALQEALNKIDALEARLTALEAKP